MTTIAVHPAGKKKVKPPEDQLGFGIHFSDHLFRMDYTEERGWHDARVTAYEPLVLDPAAAVFHYGQAMFEGLKAFRGDDGKVRLFRLDRHAERMAGGIHRMCIPPVDPGVVRDAVTALVRTDRDWVPSAAGTALYLRPTIIATEPFLGVRPAREYVFFIIASPVGAYYAEGLAPVRIRVEQTQVRAAKGGLGAVKAGANYVASLRAAHDAKGEGFAQVLWLDAVEHRYLEEVGTMNLFVRLNDELVTPPLGGSILAGVTRDAVLRLAGDWGVKVSERAIAIDEVRAAHQRGTLQEVFGTGTAAVVSPVGELSIGDEKLVIGGGKVGELAGRFYDAISGIQRGRVADTYGWLSAPI